MGLIAHSQPRAAIHPGNPIVFPGHVHRERRVRIHAQLKPDVEPCNVLAGVGLALAVTLGRPPSAVAEPATPPTQMADELQQGGITPVYFGNGCFWGRQKDFVDTERTMGRVGRDVSAVVGYAGGKREASNGKVCYYYSLPDTVYEKLGHAEVVQVDLMGAGGEKAEQMKMFASTYFSQFKKTRNGMMRLDPMDTGAGYRNVVGIPGGVNGPYMGILREANVNGMELREGKGNEYVRGRATEPDQVNVVYIVDSSSMGFHLAEKWHQFHNGIGKAFPEEYTRQQKNLAMQAGRIGSTGCPEYPFL